MNESTKTQNENGVNIFSALAKAQRDFKPVQKSGKNQAQGYAYADLDDYLSAVRSALAQNELAITSNVIAINDLEPRTTKQGGHLFVVRATLQTRLIHSSGESIETISYGDGMDSGDKAIFKAVTGARKYGLAALLGLATTDDPEEDRAPAHQMRQQPRPQSEEKKATPPSMLASEAKINLIVKLAKSHKVPQSWRDKLAHLLTTPMHKNKASEIIEQLIAILGQEAASDSQVAPEEQLPEPQTTEAMVEAASDSDQSWPFDNSPLP